MNPPGERERFYAALDLQLDSEHNPRGERVMNMERLKSIQHVGSRRIILCWLAGLLFIFAGINHFLKPEFYERIVPPGFPSPRILVIASAIAEIAGGLGLLIRPLRAVAGWGLIALLVAVFPANIYMALRSDRFEISPWILWARLPLQPVLMICVWWVALCRSQRSLTVPNPPH